MKDEKKRQRYKGKKTRSKPQIPVVGVGASAGGLDAFKKLFEGMPKKTGIAFVLIQHLDPTHESMMVDLLSRYTRLNVIQVEDRMQVEANHVYMIPFNRDLAIRDGELRLTEPVQPRGMRMPIDFFFRSLAEDQHERAICIILSGTGSDGTLGLKAIKGFGGMAMAQTPKEAHYDGMPISAISTGAVDYVLEVKDMPETLLKYVQHSYVRGRFGTEPLEENEPPDLNSILAILQAQLGHNFHYYKKNTLTRRIKRRMGLKQLEAMPEYIACLRDNPAETKELFKDMLIGVTGFFRERQSWEALEAETIRKLVGQKKGDTPLRIWVPGCSSGEEAYTLAILFSEHLQAAHKRSGIQIFATDIDTDALEHARIGRYPKSIAADLSPQRLQEFFTKEDDFFQISSRLRDSIVFSEQNILGDPPFSKLDLISCRNLLIYMEMEVQQRIIELFHFALRDNGYLLLGNSETIGQQYDLFETVSKKWRIFRRIDSTPRRRASFPILPGRKSWGRLELPEIPDIHSPLKLFDMFQRALLSEYAPASVLINRKNEVLYHYGATVDYLHFPTGEQTADLFSLLREGLITRVRSAVHRVNHDGTPVEVTGARVKRSGKYYPVKFSVTTLKHFSGNENLLMICFQDESQPPPRAANLPETSSEDEAIVKQLEYELNATKEDLQNTIEELETANEELKASNEEVVSMNEELQSTNEELETSKEELQSLNEELNTVNSQLQEKVGHLEKMNDHLTNLINSTNIASIFLDSMFRIKFFTPTSKNLFGLIATDIGRPIDNISPRFHDPDLQSDSRKVIETLRVLDKEVCTEEGQWYTRRIQPYRTQDNRIDGLVMSFTEISQQKNVEMALQETNRELDILVKKYSGDLEVEREKRNTAKKTLNKDPKPEQE